MLHHGIMGNRAYQCLSRTTALAANQGDISDRHEIEAVCYSTSHVQTCPGGYPSALHSILARQSHAISFDVSPSPRCVDDASCFYYRIISHLLKTLDGRPRQARCRKRQRTADHAASKVRRSRPSPSESARLSMALAPCLALPPDG